ncbi:heme ABC transporter permease [Gammaproteobacteria bacterium]|nr:heme ABC transporter permease [Gammaproteobacteria bacterium]MDB4059557.1 heme ABC transporter permease [Gammaproteobacteria bacterium]
MLKKLYHQFASPKTYIVLVNKMYPYIFYFSLITYVIALVWGLAIAPADYVQGNSFRIMYLHVPASFLSQSLYFGMAIAALVFLVWKVKLAAYMVKAIAPIGALVTFIALISGSIWGIPTWGTWWQWDARITSTLILFIMYLGLISLHSSFTNFEKADKFISILVLVGVVNIPIIKKSVDWWSTLHQPASITLSDKPSIDPSMLYPLFASMIGFSGLIICLVILSSKVQIFNRESNKSWVRDNV